MDRKAGESIPAEPVLRSRVPNERAVRAQLASILASKSFSKSERLSGFLSFIVYETLRGAGDELKESVLAREVYGKGANLEAGDPAVRVDARRLRDKLREYYSESRLDPVLVSVPKGSYVPVFEWNPQAIGLAIPQPIRPERETRSGRLIHRSQLAAALCLLAAIGLSVWLIGRNPAAVPVPVPLSAYPGAEGPPSLSPDGQFVVFAWAGTSQPPVEHIYIKEVHGEALRRLTNSSESERNPAWSPDGAHIAFIRARKGVFVVSPLGGPEQNVCDSGTHVGWSSDSKSILIRDTPGGREHGTKPFGIYEVSLETKERRQITQAPTGIGDWVFSVSPDGKTLAFARYGFPGVADVFVVPMSGGEPRQLTNWGSSGVAVAWTPNGREIVYSVREPQGGRLWRIPLNQRSPGRGTPVAGQIGDANFPSISRPGPNAPVRLAYQVDNLDVGLRLVDLSAVSGGTLMSVQPVADSTRVEIAGRFSPDAARIVFVSDRSGTQEIWTSNRDGSDLRQLTSLASPHIVPTGWSPDGRMLAVQATIAGNTDVYVVPATGGKLKRLTREPSIDSSPSWSRDGKWIYFSSDRPASSDRKYPTQIWRMPAEGGDTVQITRNGGILQQASFDGKYLYYLDRPNGIGGIGDMSTLMRMPVEGGQESKIVDGIRGSYWSVARNGIFFLARDGRADTIKLLRFEDGMVVPVGDLPFRISGVAGGLTVSEDGRWLLTAQTNRHDSDLMLIDSFR